MKQLKMYFAGLLTGLLLISIPIFADSYARAIDAVVNFTNMQVNGKTVESDNMLIDDKTYIWIRDVANMLDKDIVWDEETNTANIVDKGSVPVEANTAVSVDNTIITDRKIKSFMITYPSLSKEDVIERLVENTLVANQAGSIGVDIQEMETQAQAALEKDKTNPGYQDYLAKKQLTEQEYLNLLTENNLCNAVYQTLKTQATFDDATYERLYTQYKDYFETVTAKHILISTRDPFGNPLPEADIKAAEQEAAELYNKLQHGADFDTLMAEHSDDVSSKNDKAGLTFSKGEMVKVFEDAAFSQEIGKIYPAVKTDYGYHLILVLNHQTLPLEQAKEQLAEIAFEEYFADQISIWKGKADIQYFQDIIDLISID